MKYSFFILFVLLVSSCSIVSTAPTSKKLPGSHILTTNKKVLKDNMKFHKEHQKASRKKREELATYLQTNGVSTEKSQKKSKKNQ